MAALKEEQCYGLSCGRVSNGSNVSVFHVKLTDSALKAFEAYQSSRVSGAFSVPCRPGRLPKSVLTGGGRSVPAPPAFTLRSTAGSVYERVV